MNILRGLALTVICTTPAFAQSDIQLHGTTQYPLTNTTHAVKQVPEKSISLLNITLSDKAWKKLNKTLHAQEEQTLLMTKGSNFPSAVQLGMNHVPVLDQGPYGTCVTFAVTAAIDAALNKGDYISQLCQLQLGQYLEQTGYAYSGWNGSVGSAVLSQMDTFGFVTKKEEQTNGCGGLTAYPTDGQIPVTPITPEAYHQKSLSLSDENNDAAIAWTSLLDTYQSFLFETDGYQTLNTVKKALHEGDRATFGILLFLPQTGVMGAVGSHHVANDTWILTPSILSAIQTRGLFGGHEMVITGYDDNATAKDQYGFTQRGLLTLRNSWGSEVGDAGNFYMSYEYFKLLTTNVERIRQM